MATYNDGELATLSKIKISNTPYALVDAGARAVIDTLDSAITVINGNASTEGSTLYKIYNNAKDAVYSTQTVDETTTVTTIAQAIAANAAAIDAVNKGQFQVVSSGSDIPVSASGLGFIYLVPKTSPNTGYSEWIVINTGTEAEPVYAKEEIGDTDIDFTGYATESYVQNYAKDATYSVDSDTQAVTTIAQAIAANTSAINALNASTSSVIATVTGGTLTIDSTDSSMAVWTPISTTSATVVVPVSA